ncbi:MAG: GntR family transcriptional regulator [Actinomycetota bacterium]|nr:GntR family transcriptional regulator [Actinomycetota bacterium]
MTVIKLGGRSHGSGRPRRARLLYEEVIDLIDQLVVERGLGPGDMLPSQGELASLAKVSLITVRRALEELERDGRVRRHQGLGTFLARPKILADPTRSGALGDTLSTAPEPTEVTTRLLSIVRGQPSGDVAAALEIAAGEQVWQVKRLRLIASVPSIVETAIIPIPLAPDLPEVCRTGSLYETLRTRYGLDDDYEEQLLDVVHPTAEQRSLLRLTPRTFVVRIQGITRDRNGTPFDCFEQVYPASEFAFAIAGQAERRLHQGKVSRDWSVSPVQDGAPAGSPGGAERADGTG